MGISYGKCIFNLLINNPTVFQSSFIILHMPKSIKVLNPPHPPQFLLLQIFLNFSNTTKYVVSLLFVLNCISLLSKNVEHDFMYLCFICISCLGKGLFKYFVHSFSILWSNFFYCNVSFSNYYVLRNI